MTVRIVPLTAAEFDAAAPALVEVYIAAMGYPARIHAHRVSAWRRDSARPGFRAFCAVRSPAADSPAALRPGSPASSPAGSDARVLGVAYGFHGSPQTWWHQQVQRGVAYRRLPAALLDGYFEVAEVQVSPEHQGRGLGRRLLRALLDVPAADPAHGTAPETHALLSTPEVPGEDNHAFRLYRSLGFHDVLRTFYFPGDSRPFAVLGAPLPLPAP